jgi:outer membrane protein assembly factor BamB
MGSCPWVRLYLPAGLLLSSAVFLVAGITYLTYGPGEADTVHAAEPVAAGAPSWPMFGGTPSRNMVNLVEKNLPDDWSVEPGKEKNLKWTAQLGTNSWGGPVIADGKVFVGTNNDKPRNPKIEGDKGVVMCFRESDGQFLWQAVHDKLGNSEIDFAMQGVASTPTVEGKRLYYVSNRCEVVCATTDGKPDKTADILWRYDMIKELGVYPNQVAACAPLVVGDLVFVVTDNGTNGEGKVPAPKAPSFIAVNKGTGKLVWQDNSPGDKVMEGQWANPTYAEVNGKGQVIFPGGDGWLYGFEPTTGKLLWKFDCNPKSAEYKNSGGTRNYLVSTPVVYDNKVYVGVGRNPDEGAGVGHLWCVDITKTGDLSPVGDNFDPKAAVNKGSGLVWHFGGLTGAKTGRKFHFARTVSSCCIHDGLVYIADIDGFVFCLDAKTGQKYWDHDLKAAVWGSCMYIDGKVYLGDDNGEIVIFPTGKVKKEGEIRTIDMQTQLKSTPIAVNGVLYVQTAMQLYAIGKK